MKTVIWNWCVVVAYAILLGFGVALLALYCTNSDPDGRAVVYINVYGERVIETIILAYSIIVLSVIVVKKVIKMATRG